MPECDAALGVEPMSHAVRSPMGHLAGQSLDLGWRDGFSAKLHDSRNSTHLRHRRHRRPPALSKAALSMKPGMEKPATSAARHGKTAEISAESPRPGRCENARSPRD